eukprot:403342641
MKINEEICFSKIPSYSFPQVLGSGVNASSTCSFTAIYYDSTNQQILLGGNCEGSDILDTTKNGVQWHKQATTTSSAQLSSYQYISLQQSVHQYVLAVTDDQTFSMQVIDYSNGSIVNNYYITDENNANIISQATVFGFTMDASEKIYVLFSTGGYLYWTVFQFDTVSQVITPSVYTRIGYTSTNYIMGKSASFATDYSFVYVGGSSQGKPAMARISFTDGKMYAFGVISVTTSVSNNYIDKIAHYYDSVNSNYQQIGCIQNMGTSGFDIGFVQANEVFEVTSSYQKAWVYSRTQPTMCLDIKNTNTHFYFLINSPSENYDIIGNVDITTNPSSVTLTKIRISSDANKQYALSGYIDNDGEYFFSAGKTKMINSYDFTQDVAYINKWPLTSSCLSFNPSIENFSWTYQSSFASGTFKNPTYTAPVATNLTNGRVRTYSGTTYVAAENISLVDLKSLNIKELPDECLEMPSAGTISAPSLNSQTYVISDAQITTDQPNAFTYSISCSETLDWTYSAQQSNGSTLPSFISFQNSTQQFIIYSTSDSDFGTYYIELSDGHFNLYYNFHDNFHYNLDHNYNFDYYHFYNFDYHQYYIYNFIDYQYYNHYYIDNFYNYYYTFSNNFIISYSYSGSSYHSISNNCVYKLSTLFHARIKVISLCTSWQQTYLLATIIFRSESRRPGYTNYLKYFWNKSSFIHIFTSIQINVFKAQVIREQKKPIIPVPQQTVPPSQEPDLFIDKNITLHNAIEVLELTRDGILKLQLPLYLLDQINESYLQKYLKLFISDQYGIAGGQELLYFKFNQFRIIWKHGDKFGFWDEYATLMGIDQYTLACLAYSIIYYTLSSYCYDNSNFVYLIGPPMFVMMLNIFLVMVYKAIPNSKYKQKYDYNFQDKSIKKYLNELRDPLINGKLSSALYYTIFAIRRLFFIFIVQACEDYLFIQLLLFILSNLAYLIYLTSYRPINEGLYVEIFNELVTLIISYKILMYTDFVLDLDLKIKSQQFFNMVKKKVQKTIKFDFISQETSWKIFRSQQAFTNYKRRESKYNNKIYRE